MEDEQLTRFLTGRYDYKISLTAEEDIKQEFHAKMKDLKEAKFEAVAPNLPPSFIVESASLVISAISLLYSIYSDRRKKDPNVKIILPNMTIININKMEDFNAVVERLKSIDPHKEDEERKKVIEYFRKLYRDHYGDV